MGENRRMLTSNIEHLSISDSLEHVIKNSDVQGIVDARVYDQFDELDEISIYASLDPILGDLVKQYKDAEKHSLELDQTFSDDDPMAEIAHDRKDSAWCAVETRLLELREDEQFTDMVVMRLMRLEEERAGLVKRDKKQEEDFIVRKKIDDRIEAREQNDHDADVLMFFLWMWLTKQWAEKSMKAQCQLQNCFRVAA